MVLGLNGIWPMTFARVPRQRAISPKFSDAAETAMRDLAGPDLGNRDVLDLRTGRR
jgi:hypothetical protein